LPAQPSLPTLACGTLACRALGCKTFASGTLRPPAQGQLQQRELTPEHRMLLSKEERRRPKRPSAQASSSVLFFAGAALAAGPARRAIDNSAWPTALALRARPSSPPAAAAPEARPSFRLSPRAHAIYAFLAEARSGLVRCKS